MEAIETISQKWWAPILIALLYTPASLIMFPRPLLTLASAVAFGPWSFLAIAAVGMVPAAPFSVEMIVAGALRIPLLDLLLGVALAHLPGIIATTVLGDQVVAAFTDGREINRGIIAAVVIGFVAIGFFSHRMWKRMEATG